MRILFFTLTLLLTACTDKSEPEGKILSGDELVQRGKQIYNLNCIACHNSDPSKDGAAGPALSGSSRELLEARLLKASYPEGYKPKRDSKLMVAMSHLEKEIAAIEAFLNKK